MSKPILDYAALEESRRALADSEEVLARTMATSPPLRHVFNLQNTRYAPLPPTGQALFERPPLPPRDLADSWYSGVPPQRHDARGYQSPSGSPSHKEAHKSFLPHQLEREKEKKKTEAAPAAPRDAAPERPPPVAVPHTPLEVASEAEARAAEASAAAASAAASALVREAAAVASAAGAAAADLRASSESGVKQVAVLPQTPGASAAAAFVTATAAAPTAPTSAPIAAHTPAGSATCTPATPSHAVRPGREESPVAVVTKPQCEAAAVAAASVSAAALGAEGAGHLSDSRGGSRCRGVAEAEHVERARQLTTLLRNWPAFGLCAIFATHPVPVPPDGDLSSWLDAVLLKVSPLLVVAAQLAALPLMLVASVADGAQGCDASVPALTRGLVATVALLYLARSLTVLRARWAEHTGAVHAPGASLGLSEAARRAAWRREESGLALSPLAELCGIDAALHATYEGVARLLGLWLVSHASGAAPLLAYTVAVEVLIRLDEACKAWYLEARGEVVGELLSWQLDATPMLLLGRDGGLRVHPYWRRRPAQAVSVPAPSDAYRAEEASGREGAEPAKLGTLSQLVRLARALVRLAKLRWFGSQRGTTTLGGGASSERSCASSSRYGWLDAEGGLIANQERRGGAKTASDGGADDELVDVYAWRRHRIGRGVDALMSTAHRLSWPLRSFGPRAVAFVVPSASVFVLLVGPAGPSC